MTVFRSQLFHRLAGLFLLAGLLPVLGAGYLTQRLVADSVLDEAERRETRLAELTAALTSDAVARAEEKLVTVARLMATELVEREVGAYATTNLDYRSAVLERLGALVEPEDLFLELQYFASGPETQFVGLQQQRAVDPGSGPGPGPGPEAATTRRAPQILSNQLNAAVQVPLLEATPWRAAALEDLEGITTFSLSAPVHDPQAGVLGALVAYIDFSALGTTLARVAGEDYALTVADGAGRTLIAIGDAGADPLEAVVALQDPGSGWTASVREPRARVTASLSALRRQATLWTVFAALLAVLLSLAFATWITRPIRRLREAAGELAAGNLEARAGLTRADEIGQLGRAFDTMAAALAQLDQAKSDFVANVSHELRTPLTSMRVSVANLLDGVVGAPDEGQRRSLGRIQGDLERMIALVNTLLEMARLAAGTITPARETVDLRALADEGPALVQAAARERDTTFAISGQGTALADRDMLRRVLVNLLDNAVKFGPAGGSVRVEVAPGRLTVRDEGPGVALANPFERFRQGANEGVKNPGVGLGLAIVSELVRLNGGSVRVEREGTGATFVVELEQGDS